MDRTLIPLGLLIALPAIGQDSRIVGHITDARQAAVATAVVSVTNVDSESRRQVLSNAQGYFQLAPLAPGRYRIDAVKPGFRPYSRTLVGLNQGSSATVDLQMEDAEVSEIATVEARKAGGGSLLTYICGLSQGSGCEMIDPVIVLSQTDSPFLP